jgi:hypothetical protein
LRFCISETPIKNNTLDTPNTTGSSGNKKCVDPSTNRDFDDQSQEGELGLNFMSCVPSTTLVAVGNQI